MRLTIKDILYDKNNLNVKAYLHRQRASSNIINEIYITKEDGTLVSTSDDLYDKVDLHLEQAIDLRQIERENISQVHWIYSLIKVMDNHGGMYYKLYINTDQEYIGEIIQNRMQLQMFYPILFFLLLALFYILYIKRMVIKPIMIIDEFLRGVIEKIPKFYIFEFNNLAKNLENNINRLKTMAYYDTLTGVYNRKGMGEYIKDNISSRRDRGDGSFTIALIDLDHFKKINDTSGHEVGDALLKEVVKVLDLELEAGDKLGRLGGDEFLIVFNYEKIDEVSHKLERIIERFQQPFMVNDKELFIEASIGVSDYPSDGSNLSTLLKHADFAMYQAKEKGGNAYVFFSKELGLKVEKELQLETEIKHALENDEFFLVYQPILDAMSEKVVSVEALARWKHPKKGMIDPSEFISIIENGCCVKEFGEWVLDTACTQQEVWLKKGIDITISINLSVKHIMSSNFYKRFQKIVRNHHVDHDKLKLEITEYTLMEYKGATINVLKKMKKDGYHFTLDDFGTGYSSITYLQNTPIEAVKIDKSFVDEITADKKGAKMLDGILNLTKIIGLPSIAEGVENLYQVEYLKDAGCDMIQGYYYSKALDALEFEKFYKVRELDRLSPAMEK